VKHLFKLLLALQFLLSFNPLHAALPKGIDWHKGTVKSALILAKKENRPIFLYWGAVWCPPCKLIKKIVFESPEFKKTVKNFIPVYLDGDDKRAQYWGAKYKFQGYPTTLVINPKGEEVIRFPTEPNVVNYISLMNQSLKNLDPIETILERAKLGKATKSDWEIAGGYYYDSSQLIKDENKYALFKELYEKVPVRYKNARDKLFLNYLSSWLDKFTGNKKKIKNDPEKTFFKKELVKHLGQYEFIRQNLETLTWGGIYSLNNLFEKPELIIREKAFLKKMEKMMDDKTISTDERLWSLIPWIKIEQKSGKPFSKKLLSKLKEMAKWADQKTVDPFERHAVMGTILSLLKKTGLDDLGYVYAQKELKTSKTPYYFMSKLAKIEERRGNKNKALNWFKLAFESAKGPVTRFSWGNAYLRAIMKLRPKNYQFLLNNALPMYQKVLIQEDAFWGGYKANFEYFATSFKKWTGDSGLGKIAIKKVKSEFAGLCLGDQVQINKTKCLKWAESL